VRACALLLALGTPALSGSREIEVGVENLYYRTATTPLNEANVLGLDPSADILRGTLGYQESFGAARAVLRGVVERDFGRPGAGTTWGLRQGYLQYWWGSSLGVRVGKQRIAWGSGIAWNPTNRLEPPKNPLNTSLEQEGALAVRMDFVPSSWAGVVLAASEAKTVVGDLPFSTPTPKRRTAALRARFLVSDTDLALVLSGGANQRSLYGFDVGREIGAGLAAHAEGAFYRGAELRPSRDGQTFFRLAAGLLYAYQETSLAIEYFRNGEGYSKGDLGAYLGQLGASFAGSSDPGAPPAQRASALASYLDSASIPYTAGLGLRRHYLQGSWTRAGIRGKWSASVRGLLGLSDGGLALTPGIGYAPRGDLTMSLDGLLLIGPHDSEYRLAPVKGALQARVKVLF